MTNILPGDVAMMIMGTQSNPEALAGLRQSLGLNDPLVVQYGRWIAGMLTGDWGNSLIFKVPITELLGQKIRSSALVVALSMAIALAAATRGQSGRVGACAPARSTRHCPGFPLGFARRCCRRFLRWPGDCASGGWAAGPKWNERQSS